MKEFIFKVAEKLGDTKTAEKENIYDMILSLFYAIVFMLCGYIVICIAYTRI